jgi:hypothetical protein
MAILMETAKVKAKARARVRAMAKVTDRRRASQFGELADCAVRA